MNSTPASNSEGTDHNLTYWFHVLITFLAWSGPFLFSWYLMALAYGIVTLQFIIFKRCLLNAKHNLKDENDVTFYSYLFDQVGISYNRQRLKFWVRNLIYPILGIISYLWQEVLGIDPLLFF